MRKKRGMTLLEVLLVLMVITVGFSIISINVPSLRTAWSLKNESLKMRGKLRHYQQRAINTQKTYRFFWDPAGDYYSVYEESSPGIWSIKETVYMKENVDLDSTTFAAIPPGDYLDFDQFGVPNEGGDVRLSDGIKLLTVRVFPVTGRVYFQ